MRLTVFNITNKLGSEDWSPKFEIKNIELVKFER